MNASMSNSKHLFGGGSTIAISTALIGAIYLHSHASGILRHARMLNI